MFLLYFLSFAGFFSKLTFSKISYKNSISLRVSNSLDPDQARHYVGPDLDPNCLQRLSANEASRQKVKGISKCIGHLISRF